MGYFDWLKEFEAPEPIRRTPTEIADLIHRFLHELHQGNNLTPEQARQRAEKNLVEIQMYGQHSSNGLLITTDGYFLTAYHCVTDDIKSTLTVRTADNRVYPFERICHALPKLDLALAKATIPVPAEPIHHAFYGDSIEQLHQSPAVALSLRNGAIVSKTGVIRQSHYTTLSDPESHEVVISPEESVELDQILCRKGDSGGPIISAHGRVIGTLFGANNEIGKESATGIQISCAIGMLYQYEQILRGNRPYK